MNKCLHAWVWTLQDVGLPVQLISSLDPQGLPKLVWACLWCTCDHSSLSPPVHRPCPCFPPAARGVLDFDSCPPSSPQRLDQELKWSWGHRLRSALDRAEAMAPPPSLPLAASTPLLHGEFGSYPARGQRFALTLTPQALHIQRLRPKPEARPRGGLVLLVEVSGCCTLRSRSPSDSAAYFCIYTYPRGRRGGRRRATRTFCVDGADTYEENRAEAQRWATALTCLLRGLPLPGDGGEVLSNLGVSSDISLCGHLCLCLSVCQCDVSLWVRIEGVIPDRNGLQKEQNHRLRKIICICWSLTRFLSLYPPPFHGS